MAWPQSGVHCRRKLMGTPCSSSDSTVQVPSDQIEFDSPHSPRPAIQSIRSVLPRQAQYGQKRTLVICLVHRGASPFKGLPPRICC